MQLFRRATSSVFTCVHVQPDDTELQTRGGHWSSANKDLWARYFRARAGLTESIQRLENVRALLEQASHALVGTEAGWHSGEVSKFQVNVLSQMYLTHPRSARRKPDTSSIRRYAYPGRLNTTNRH